MKKTLATIFTVGALAVVWGMYDTPKREIPPEIPITVGATTAELLAQEESIFAVIDSKTGEVLRTMVITQEEINKGRHGDPANFVRTSKEGTIRKNYAGKGMKYDETRDAFIPPKVDPNSIFNEEKAIWETPQEMLSMTASNTPNE
jgi:hypothetical protein